jgi:uncharacterized damage-inducible protein DinB
LEDEMKTVYTATERLLDKVDEADLGWKPETGSNWMTMGQLLKHLSDGCGAPMKGFVTGDWGLPPGTKLEDLPPDAMLPPAEKLPAAGSVAEVKKLLAKDRALAFQMVEQAGENDLAGRMATAPWAPGVEKPLGRMLLNMVQHLDRHKSQLFYYLKLRGVRVDTADLWGE